MRLKQGEKSVKIEGKIVITQSSIYSEFLLDCSLPSASLVVDGMETNIFWAIVKRAWIGHIKWRNSYGYLPGHKYGLLPFLLALCCIYLVYFYFVFRPISFVWNKFNLKHFVGCADSLGVPPICISKRIVQTPSLYNRCFGVHDVGVAILVVWSTRTKLKWRQICCTFHDCANLFRYVLEYVFASS